MPVRDDRRWVALIFVTATLARLAGQVVLGAYAHPRVFEYEEIATNLLAGRGYTYGSADGGIYVASQSSPLYIVMTALVYLVTGHSQSVMLVLQALLGGLTAALALWVAARVFSRGAGLAAGLLVAFDPALIVFAADLHSLTFDALSNVALLAGSVALPMRPKAGPVAGLGALFGMAALSRATALLLLPVHLLWLVRVRALRVLGPGLLLVVLAALVYAPWPVRNSVLLGQVTLGSSETSEWLWRGNNPNANGGSLTADGQRMLDVAPPDFRLRVQVASEPERMTIYRDAAVAFITGDPLAALRLYVTKLGAFWWGTDTTGLLYPDSWLVAYRLWYVAIVLLAVLGAASALRHAEQRSVVMLMVASLVVVSAAQAIFYVEGRHRVGVEALILILSGVALSRLLRSGSPRQVRLGVAGLFSSAPRPHPENADGPELLEEGSGHVHVEALGRRIHQVQ